MIDPIQVEIIEADIKAAEGQAGVYNKCPVAQALIRLGFLDIDVDEDRILVTKPETPPLRLVSKTPMPVSLLIGDFDNDQPVMPLSFSLNELRFATQADERKKIGENTIDSELLKKFYNSELDDFDIDEDNWDDEPE